LAAAQGSQRKNIAGCSIIRRALSPQVRHAKAESRAALAVSRID
jgi:hypothetical protein